MIIYILDLIKGLFFDVQNNKHFINLCSFFIIYYLDIKYIIYINVIIKGIFIDILVI